ncbi:hypothetical protein BHC44_09535 [Snodgrassella alvi]|nr:hypothetical protein BHC44_09535 [Snodgrassella alvi]
MISKAETLLPEDMYPVARRNKHKGFIVIFTGARKGTVVSCDEKNPCPTGYQADDWIPCYENDEWIPLTLTIYG